MGTVHESTTSEDIPSVSLHIVGRDRGEMRDAWKIVELDIDTYDYFTPKELCSIGKWLYSEGKRISRAYKPNGHPARRD